MWQELRTYAAAGGTVLLTTHYVEEAEALASRIVLLARGRVVTEGSPAELSRRAGVPRLEDAFVALTGAGR